MKRTLMLWALLAGIATGCRPVYIYNVGPRHDNGLHKGWYKHGRVKGIPPGQAKKMGKYKKWK